jgi:hypothetical protein
MFEKFTEEEWDNLIDWLLRMAKFWSISGLAYVTIFYRSTLAAWILVSLMVLFVWDMYKETKNDTDNGHETAE